MPESVGNEANSVNNVAPFIRFNLALSATQVDHESDSFGTDYDEVVPYPIVGADNDGTGTVLYNELRNKTPEILLGADANRYYGWSVISAATLDLNGRKLTADRGYQHVLSVDENGELTLTGNGTVDASTINAGSAVQVADGGKLTLSRTARSSARQATAAFMTAAARSSSTAASSAWKAARRMTPSTS